MLLHPRVNETLRRWSATGILAGEKRVKIPILRTFLIVLVATTIAQAASTREIAEWVIRWEGQFTVEGRRTPVTDLSEIPEGAFEIVRVDLTGAVMPPADLAMLSSLTSLRELYLPGPIWNPGGGREDANEAFESLSSLKRLEKIGFGWHYAAQINIQDSGFQHLLGLTELKDIRCAQCRLTDIDLSPLVNLRSLDLTDSPFTDTGMAGLAEMKNLKRLILRNTMVTDEGMRHLSGLTQLEELSLGGTRVTARGVEYLRGMAKMRKLQPARRGRGRRQHGDPCWDAGP